jgi:hypothetical protein
VQDRHRCACRGVRADAWPAGGSRLPALHERVRLRVVIGRLLGLLVMRAPDRAYYRNVGAAVKGLWIRDLPATPDGLNRFASSAYDVP